MHKDRNPQLQQRDVTGTNLISQTNKFRVQKQPGNKEELNTKCRPFPSGKVIKKCGEEVGCVVALLVCSCCGSGGQQHPLLVGNIKDV